MQNANLSGPISDAKAFAASAAALPCTLTYKSWNGSLTVNGGPGTNVICVGSVRGVIRASLNEVRTGPEYLTFVVCEIRNRQLTEFPRSRSALHFPGDRGLVLEVPLGDRLTRLHAGLLQCAQ